MKLLKTLYSIYSGSHKEGPMREFILSWIKKHIKDAEVSVDKAGNVLVTRGKSETYPCIVSHMDQVQRPYPEMYQVMSNGHVIFAMDVKTREYCGLGADDKNGIWICLNALKAYKVMKCVFFVEEECGMGGSRQVDMAFFNDARWVIQCDRKGHQDFIYHTNGTEVCTKKFSDACNLKSHRYERATGTATDIGTLKNRGLKVCAVNLSCGYYEAHSSREYTIVDDLLKCQKLVHFIVERLTDVYPHEKKVEEKYIPRDYSGYNTFFTHGYSHRVKSNKERVKDYIGSEMEKKLRNLDKSLLTTELIDNMAKRYYNNIGSLYNVSINDINAAIMEVIAEWNAEDYQEELQALSDDIYALYDDFVSELQAEHFNDDGHYDNVIEDGFEPSEDDDKTFVIGVCTQIKEVYPSLTPKDVLEIFNTQFGTAYDYESWKDELEDAVKEDEEPKSDSDNINVVAS